MFDFDLGLFEDLRGRAADVEGAHGELGAGFADGLCGDDANGFADAAGFGGGEVEAVAFGADAVFGFAGEDGADADFFDAEFFDGGSFGLCDEFAGMDDGLSGDGVFDVVAGGAAVDAVHEFDDFVFAFVDGFDPDALSGATIFLGDGHVHGDVAKFASHVAGVGCFERGICKAFAGAVGGDEVFEDGEAFAEVGEDGAFDDFAGGAGHEAAHARELFDLLAVAARTGIHHEVDGVDFGAAFVVFERAEEDVGDFFAGVGPDVYDAVVAFAVGDDSGVVLFFDDLNLLGGAFDFDFLFRGDDHVGNADGDACACGFFEAEFFEAVEGFDSLSVACDAVAGEDDVAEAFFGDRFVVESYAWGPDGIEDNAADGGFQVFFLFVAVDGVAVEIWVFDDDVAVCGDAAFGFGEEDFVEVAEEGKSCVRVARFARVLGEVVAAKDDVLGGCGDRAPAGGGEDVVGGEHVEASF